MKKKISVILPTFNERETIEKLVGDVHDQLSDHPHEIIVVDDNSPDGTFKHLESLNFDYLKPLLRTSDPGLGQSIRHGLENASGEIFLVMDSDYNHKPEYIPILIHSLEFYDVAMGSRFLYGGRGANPYRHLLSWSFNIFIRILTDGRITDSLFGYYAVHREKMEELNYDEIFWGFGEYGIRLTYFMQKAGHRILQVPTVFGDRIAGTGHGDVVKVFITYTMAALRLLFKHGRISVKKVNRKLNQQNIDINKRAS